MVNDKTDRPGPLLDAPSGENFHWHTITSLVENS